MSANGTQAQTYDAAFRRAEPFVSGTNAVARSLDPRLELGTDFEGKDSGPIWFLGMLTSSGGGDVSCDPERLLLVLPGGDVKLEVEYRLVREKTEENDWSRRSGGVVGSL